MNNLRDLPTDRAANKRTLATRVGDRATRFQYSLFVLASYAIPAILAFVNHADRWLMLTWLTAPLGFILARIVVSGTAGRELNPILKKSGQLLLLFGVLLAVGAAIGRS